MSLQELAERYFQAQHAYDPYSATLLGLQEFDHLSPDPSFEASEGAAEKFAQISTELDSIDYTSLTVAEQVDHGVLSSLSWGAGRDAHHALWAANASAASYASWQGLLFQAIPAMTVVDADGADRYLSRLSGVARTLVGLGERYRHEADRGRAPAAVSVSQAIEQLIGYMSLPLEEDALLKPTNSVEGGSVRERAITMVRSEIRPAMAALAQRMRSELLPLARDDDRVGIHHVRGGLEAYADAVRRHTTTDRSPEDIHRLGLAILAEMREQWSEIGERALGVSEVAEIASRMRNDPNLRSQTREQIVKVAQDALDRAEDERDRFFPPYHIPRCVIEEINPIDAHNSALAYYRPPALDGSRPGAYCLLAADPGSRYLYEYEALTFHESTPGHHLQLATAQTLEIPRYRQHLDTELCGFIEGWGLYAEELADEMGLYSDDLQRLGMLSFAALRACRLVIDTGIHYFGWSRQHAMEFMWNNTVTTDANVRNEVDRYIAWPGQALSYMMGKQEILRLRRAAEASLGNRFSREGFHGAVLGSGAVPLSVLAANVTRWQASIS